MESSKIEALLAEVNRHGITTEQFTKRLERESRNEQQRYNKPTLGDLFPGLRNLKQ